MKIGHSFNYVGRPQKMGASLPIRFVSENQIMIWIGIDNSLNIVDLARVKIAQTAGKG